MDLFALSILFVLTLACEIFERSQRSRHNKSLGETQADCRNCLLCYKHPQASTKSQLN